jgi:hypothetical protein
MMSETDDKVCNLPLSANELIDKINRSQDMAHEDFNNFLIYSPTWITSEKTFNISKAHHFDLQLIKEILPKKWST